MCAWAAGDRHVRSCRQAESARTPRPFSPVTIKTFCTHASRYKKRRKYARWTVMRPRTWLVGRRNFAPVNITTTSFNSPRSGGIGLRTHIPHVLTQSHTGVSLNDPDTKISGVPFAQTPVKEPKSEAIPEVGQDSLQSPSVESAKPPPRKRRRVVKKDKAPPEQADGQAEEQPQFQPIRLTKDELKHLPKQAAIKAPRKKREPRHNFSLEAK